jgi:hypothetical protein
MSEEEMNLYDPNNMYKLLSKNTCYDNSKDCNVNAPYSYLELYKTNPATNAPYTPRERDEKIKQYKNSCSGKGDVIKCCDPSDTNLPYLDKYIEQDLKNKYPYVKLNREKNQLKSISICKENCPSTYTKASPYVFCKLLKDSKKNNISDEVSDLVPDCTMQACNMNTNYFVPSSYGQRYNFYQDLQIYNAIKIDDVQFLKKIIGDDYNRILTNSHKNNTIFHQSIIEQANKCITFLLSTKLDLSVKNKDGNTYLHLASMIDSPAITYFLIKRGADVFAKNIVGDTPLHSAIISGKMYCIPILLNNGASIVETNNYGDIPLHTAIKCQNKNLKIVRLLVDYGSDINTQDKKGNTLLKSLFKQKKTDLNEQIRTYLQKLYYDVNKNDYANFVKQYPEVSPYEVIAEDDEDINEENVTVEIEYDKAVIDKNSYHKKKTLPVKKLALLEGFENEYENKYDFNYYGCIIVVILVIGILIKLKYYK